MKERWKNIKEYGGGYKISNLGIVVDLKTGKQRNIYTNKFTGRQYVSLGMGKGNQRLIMLHRLLADKFIPNPKNLPCIDHIDRNYLNNNVNNLRWCTQSQNSMNRKGREGLTSKYKGVFRLKNKKSGMMFVCAIFLGKKTIYRKLFKTEEEAALQYNKIASELYGQFAHLNKINK